MSQNSTFFLSIGKGVKDEYGRTIGKIASLGVNPNGNVDFVYLKSDNNIFAKYSPNHLKIEGSEILYLSPLKINSQNICNQIPLMWRKDQALKSLLDKQKISLEVYDNLHQDFEQLLTDLKNDAARVSEEIEQRINECDDELKELNYALVNLELEHEIGKVDESSYDVAVNLILDCTQKVNLEKTDLESEKKQISNIILDESIQSEQGSIEQEATENESTEQEAKENESTDLDPLVSPSINLPEPPVVVYVNDANTTKV